jgi:biotin carboxyl carrier protein
MDTHDSMGMLNINSTRYQTRLSSRFLNRKPYKPSDPKLISSFIPGTILDILVRQGQKVQKGDELLILEAMKMQNKIKCPADGQIKKISVKKGEKVSKGSILIELK